MDLVDACGTISRHMHDALLVIDRQGVISWSNACFDARFGCRDGCASGSAQRLLRAPLLGMSVDQAVRAKGTVALDRKGRPYFLRLLLETDESVFLALLPATEGPADGRGEQLCGAQASPASPNPACGRRAADLASELARAHADYRRLAAGVRQLRSQVFDLLSSDFKTLPYKRFNC